jgi:hypothetical protein
MYASAQGIRSMRLCGQSMQLAYSESLALTLPTTPAAAPRSRRLILRDDGCSMSSCDAVDIVRCVAQFCVTAAAVIVVPHFLGRLAVIGRAMSPSVQSVDDRDLNRSDRES